jgi:hypothetical protein
MRTALRAILSGTDRDAQLWRTAVLAAGGTVSGPHLARVSKLIHALKGAGVWPTLDRLWLFAAENPTQALIDLKTQAVATLVNAPAFMAMQGYAGNGTSSYINTGFVPSTAGGKFALSSGGGASYGVYIRTNRTTAQSSAAMGASNSTNATEFLPNFAGVFYSSLSDSVEVSGVAPATVKGMWVLSRTLSASVSSYQNGALFTTITEAETGLSTHPFFVGACPNSSGVAVEFSTDQQGIAFLGAGLSAAQAAALSAATTGYLSAIGGL